MLDTVYVKSSKAKQEFQQGNRTLSLKHRQLLIMVNGKRSSSQIASIFNSDSALQMLVDLEKLGYLLSAQDTNKQADEPTTGTKASDTFSREHLVFIKTFLIEEAQLQLGLMSREIEQKVALVQNAEDLKSCIARWHMAIRDSRNGRTVADRLMERLAHLMANPPQVKVSGNAS
jgi:hypothetical protein